MTDFKVTFGKPSHGWLPISVESQAGITRDEVSDLGNSLQDLVRALNSLASTSSRETVEWALEPTIWLWTFIAEDEMLCLSAEMPGVVVEHRAPKKVVLGAFSSALLKLGRSDAWTSADAWGWDFPSEDVAQLQRAVADA